MKKMFVGALLLSSAMIVQAEDAKKGAATVSILPATKIGYISASSVLSDSKLGKKLKKELDEKYEKVASELQEKEKDIMRISNELQNKKGNMSQTAFEAEQAKAQAKAKELVQKYETLRQEKGEEFRALEQKANERLVKETLEVAAVIGQQGGYDAIVDKDSGRVLWTVDKVDCTKQLLAGLDKKFETETTKVASASTKKQA